MKKKEYAGDRFNEVAFRDMEPGNFAEQQLEKRTDFVYVAEPAKGIPEWLWMDVQEALICCIEEFHLITEEIRRGGSCVSKAGGVLLACTLILRPRLPSADIRWLCAEFLLGTPCVEWKKRAVKGSLILAHR